MTPLNKLRETLYKPETGAAALWSATLKKLREEHNTRFGFNPVSISLVRREEKDDET